MQFRKIGVEQKKRQRVEYKERGRNLVHKTILISLLLKRKN
jgi:hypothetical protein